jgi:hypothetical protein
MTQQAPRALPPLWPERTKTALHSAERHGEPLPALGTGLARGRLLPRLEADAAQGCGGNPDG